MNLWNFRGEQNNISEALQLKLPGRACISITGAGGKTSLIFAWAHELAMTGKRVGVTTTTHMMSPARMKAEPVDLYEGIRIIEAASAANDVCDEIDKAFATGSAVFVFALAAGKPDKVTIPPEEVLAHLRETADILLIEADGSKRMPLKWPHEWEPVIPEHTDVTVCVAGLSALGRAPEEVIYGFDRIPKAYLKSSGRCSRGKPMSVDEGLLRAMISSLDGGRKGVRGEFRIFMNQADDPNLCASAEKIQRELSVMGIQSAWGMLQEHSQDMTADAVNAGGKSDADPEGNRTGSGRLDERADSSDVMRIAVILEAAGNSTRFGSNKLMHIMDDGRPMITNILDAVYGLMHDDRSTEDTKGSENENSLRYQVRAVLVTQYDEVISVAKDAYGASESLDPDMDRKTDHVISCSGAGEDLSRSNGGTPALLTVINRYPDTGISHSMQLGIEAAGDADAYMFCVCDQPGITSDTLRRLIRAYIKENKNGTADIVSLAWQGRMCNPKIFSASLKDELMSLSGDTGGRQIIAAHSDKLLLVEAISQKEVEDIDFCTD